MKTLVSVAVVFLAAFFASCLHDEGGADAQSSVSRAEFDALLARVAAMESNQNRAFAAPVSGGFAKAAAQDGKLLGTTLGFDAPPHLSSYIQVKSQQGYLFSVPNTGTGVAGPTNHEIFYASNDCSGQGYMNGISDYGAQQGYVFAITANGGTTWDNPAQFYYVPAGSLRVGPINFNSRRGSLEEFCAATSGTETSAFPALSNDAAVTGVDSGPIKLPVTVG